MVLDVDGVTDVLCDDEDAMAREIPRAMTLDPAACRAHAEALFDQDLIARQYQAIFSKVISARIT